MGKPRNTRKYPTYPEIPEIPKSKKDTQKYPIVYFDTPTRPEPDLLPSILSNTRPDPKLKNPTGWALPPSLPPKKEENKKTRCRIDIELGCWGPFGDSLVDLVGTPWTPLEHHLVTIVTSLGSL